MGSREPKTGLRLQKGQKEAIFGRFWAVFEGVQNALFRRLRAMRVCGIDFSRRFTPTCEIWVFSVAQKAAKLGLQILASTFACSYPRIPKRAQKAPFEDLLAHSINLRVPVAHFNMRKSTFRPKFGLERNFGQIW